MASQDEGEKMEERPWSDLPIEILELILSLLSCSDYPYFASVCKSWSRVTPVIYPINQSPLLLHYKRIESGICHYYSPSANKIFQVDCPFDLTGYAFYSGRDGWLLVYNDGSEITLVNPLTGIFHKFPGLRERTFFNGAAFSGCPPKDCTIFLIDSWFNTGVYINIYDQEGWHEGVHYDNTVPFTFAEISNPVFFRDRFYCLGMEGNLGVYDPVSYTWNVLDNFKQFDTSCTNSYLVESGGKLMAIQTGNSGTSIHVFCLDQDLMVWEKIQSLKDQSLFLGSKMSLLTTPLERNLINKAYVPRFHGETETIVAEIKCSNGCLFFYPKSLPSNNQREETKRKKKFNICCYSLTNGECSDYFNSCEKLYCIWFEPRHHQY